MPLFPTKAASTYMQVRVRNQSLNLFILYHLLTNKNLSYIKSYMLMHTLSMDTYGQYGVYYYVNKRLIYLYTFFTTGPPFIYDHNPLSSQVLLSVLSPIELTCRSTGDPNPLVHWEKDGELLENGGRVVITPDTYGESDSVLYISETKATDTGSYECVSSNLAGEDSELFEVTVSGTVCTCMASSCEDIQ